MKKIKFPKFHIKLGIILWVIFVIIILIEAFVLYRYLYVNWQEKPQALVQQTPSLKIDFEASAQANTWFEERENFALPVYELKSSVSGRENPFAEY